MRSIGRRPVASNSVTALWVAYLLLHLSLTAPPPLAAAVSSRRLPVARHLARFPAVVDLKTERLDIRRKLEFPQVPNRKRCRFGGTFEEPSGGLQPSTPSLPLRGSTPVLGATEVTGRGLRIPGIHVTGGISNPQARSRSSR